MANHIHHRIGRRKIYFTDHALDQWWERNGKNGNNGRQEALKLLRETFPQVAWSSETPPWSFLTLWHKARAEGFLVVDENRGFVVNKNPNGELVAVTYIENTGGPKKNGRRHKRRKAARKGAERVRG